MKHLVFLFAMIVAMVATPTRADDWNDYKFYEQRTGQWEVRGYKAREKLHPICVAETYYRDGSQVRVIFDLADGELYMVVHNTDWDFTNTDWKKTMKADLVFDGRGGTTLTMYFNIINEHTVRIRNIFKDKFIPRFMSSPRMHLIMPGHFDNLTVGLVGTSTAIDRLSDCMRLSKLVDLFEVRKPPTPPTPPASENAPKSNFNSL